jgi:hypothetical protein
MLELRAAVRDSADEAAVPLLLNLGHWLPQLQSADLIPLMSETDGEGRRRRSPGPTSSRPYQPT